MSLSRTPASVRRRAASSVILPRQQRRHSSPFFALGRLSNARETQHFTKASKLSRVEHSPPLKLIQTSEVDPFASSRGTRSVTDAGKVELRTVSEEEWEKALAGVPEAGKKEVWRVWNEGIDREKSFTDVAREWKVQQKVGNDQETEKEAWDSLSERARAEIQHERLLDRSRDSSQMIRERRAKQIEGSTTFEDGLEDDGGIDPELAAKLGSAVLSKHVEGMRKLRADLKATRQELADTQDSLRYQRHATDGLQNELMYAKGGKSFNYLTIAVLSAALTYWYMSQMDSKDENSPWSFKISMLKDPLNLEKAKQSDGEISGENIRDAEKAEKYAAARQEIQDLQQKSRQDAQQMRAEHQRELAVLQGKLEEATANARNDTAGRKAIEQELWAKTREHEAKMADWTRRAAQLKQAVERKDSRSLSAAETNAYIEALVFSQVKDQPRRSWWSGWFWREG